MKLSHLEFPLLLMMLFVVLASPVQARDDVGHFQERHDEHREERRAMKRERLGHPYLPAKTDSDAGAEGSEKRECRHGCLSREDRRRLRRDINDVGREIYRPHDERSSL